ncbi:MAG: serine/threonine-protein kinase [Cyanobacteria bacterium J06639_1]
MSGSRLERKKRRSEYRLLGLIGQGQFGQVYCAVHRRTKELVALKNLDRRRFPTRDFLREFSFLVTLRHPNIVACRAIAHVPAGRQMVMDYCEGGTLRDLLDGDVPLSLKQRLALVADMLAGLAHAHANGIVHCDLKPENVLLNVTPTGWTARLSDFGLARFSRELGGQSTTETGDSGSPAYMAPERFYGEFSAASDIYAIGVMLYELICGDRPFSGTYGDLMAAHLNQPVKVPDTVPIVLRSPIVTAMHKLPQARFASAADMLDAIHLALEVGEAIARDAKEPAPGESTSRPRRILVAQPALSVPAPIVQMAAAGDRLWLSFANTLQAFAVSVVGIEQTPARSLELAHSICSLRVCETGCVAVTQPERELTPEEEVLGVQLEADREVFWVARAATSEGDAPDRELRRIEVGRSRELFIALEPGGRWVCVANGDSQDIDRSLLDVDWMERVESDRADSSAAFRFEIYKLPEWERTRLVLEETFPVEVIALDRRHGLPYFRRMRSTTSRCLPKTSRPR